MMSLPDEMQPADGLLFFCRDAGLSPEDVAVIRAVPSCRETYDKGAYLAVEGEPVGGLRLLTRGAVRTEMCSEQGFKLYVDEITAPFPLASTLLFGQRTDRFPVDVIAVEECEVTLYAKEDIEQLLRSSRPFLQGFLSMAAYQLNSLADRLRVFSISGIRKKLAYLILKSSSQGHFNFGMNITVLSQYMGVRRPSLSRELSRLVKEGIITYACGQGEILDPAGLSRLL